MVTTVPGYTFATGESVTASKLITMMEGAVLSSVVVTEYGSDSHPVTVAASDPGSPREGDVWYDSALKMVRRYVGSRWEPVGKGMALRNNTGAHIPQGALCKLTAANDVAMTSTDNDGTCIGAALVTIDNGSVGVLQSSGITQVLCTPSAGGWTAGELFTTLAASAGYGTPLRQFYSGGSTNATMRSDIGMSLGTVTISGLQTALLWR